MLEILKSYIPTSAKNWIQNQFTKPERDARDIARVNYFKNQKSLTAEQKKFWSDNGYLILPAFFSKEKLAGVRAVVDDLWRKRANPKNPLVIDAFISDERVRRMYFRDAPDEARDQPYKLNDIFLESRLVQEMVLSPELANIIAELLDGDPLVCNSLTFERSSQQDFHLDTFYMPPPIENKMCASWIALEDTHLDAGPLLYYPGSHKIPPYYFSDGRLNLKDSELDSWKTYIDAEIKKRELKVERFAAQAGDVLIWHAQLLHAGEKIRDMKRTRQSLVTHYFRAIDFPKFSCKSLGKGRHYMSRSHQKVTS